jgi:transcriptional regulator with XRE-family HTH domain
MPRPPKCHHALRTTLKLLGMTQKALAQELGIASVTIERFLSGEAAISEKLAFQISQHTGLDFEQLVLNSDPLNPRRIDGTPLIQLRQEPRPRKSPAEWLQPVNRFTVEYVHAALEAAKAAAVLDATKKVDGEGAAKEVDRFYFQAALRIALSKLIDEFGLRKATNELMGLESDATPVWSISDKKERERRKRARSARKRVHQPLSRDSGSGD